MLAGSVCAVAIAGWLMAPVNAAIEETRKLSLAVDRLMVRTP